MKSPDTTDVVAQVEAIVARRRVEPPGGPTLHAAISSLAGAEAMEDGALRVREYEITVGGHGAPEREAEALRAVRDLAPTAAPEVVALLPAGKQTVLIKRYRGCIGERIVPLSMTRPQLREAACLQFHAEMRALNARGLIHPFAHRGLAHWHMGSVSGTLVLDSWMRLARCTPAQAAEALESIEQQLTKGCPTLTIPHPPRRRRQHANAIRDVFGVSRVLLPVVHPRGWNEALTSIQLIADAGVRGLFLIDQGMSAAEVLRLVVETRARWPSLWVGVNLLSCSAEAALRRTIAELGPRIDGIWSDDAGVDEQADAQPEAATRFRSLRQAEHWDGLYFGGVAFKYQREVAAHDLARAAARAQPLMDVICTSGPGTGQAADVAKVAALRSGVGAGGAIALASGVTAENVEQYLPYVDAFLVGTGIEERFGVLDRGKLTALQQIIARHE